MDPISDLLSKYTDRLEYNIFAVLVFFPYCLGAPCCPGNPPIVTRCPHPCLDRHALRLCSEVRRKKASNNLNTTVREDVKLSFKITQSMPRGLRLGTFANAAMSPVGRLFPGCQRVRTGCWHSMLQVCLFVLVEWTQSWPPVGLLLVL